MCCLIRWGHGFLIYIWYAILQFFAYWRKDDAWFKVSPCVIQYHSRKHPIVFVVTTLQFSTGSALSSVPFLHNFAQNLLVGQDEDKPRPACATHSCHFFHVRTIPFSVLARHSGARSSSCSRSCLAMLVRKSALDIVGCRRMAMMQQRHVFVIP